ncbi:S-adenosyl-L-methionine-dependent methyltransferase [Zopfia rhizophila CBS 207.26]|uniref:S-adenosyl-L-methionine-dependent methyltransferase n=1 Tax=Zopfia rhizophila CBS 207.26 TaxID=1314779 RepID=A0A6A6E217_9PEZI|nr:S-adenosyl-L-methionine-dependent methyltransferase [Zopfia rhizophila CBS 207.26]
MPRLSNGLLRHAYTINPLLAPLLRSCRDLTSAQNELRWLREHVKLTQTSLNKSHGSLLRRFVCERASGKPLQYILGTEYFGDLEIQCRPGVLIPRQDTAASVTHLVHLLRRAEGLPSELRVLDLCTGTGCIPLLFRHQFEKARREDVRLRLLGVDVSEKAVRLAHHNLKCVFQEHGYRDSKAVIEFMMGDVLIDPCGDQTFDPPSFKAVMDFLRKPQFWNILISNPPYISPSAYWKTTTRSVRGFEPKLALVPPAREEKPGTEQGDTFYPRLLEIAYDVEAEIVLFEVADLDQALRVARMARDIKIFDGIEIWRDQPDQNDEDDPSPHCEFKVTGQGNGRSVLCWRGRGSKWLGKGGAKHITSDRSPIRNAFFATYKF